MKKKMIILAIGIIALFVGMAFVPGVNAIEENKESETCDTTDDGSIFNTATGFFTIEVDGDDITPLICTFINPFREGIHYRSMVWFEFGDSGSVKTAQYGLKDKSGEAHRVTLCNAIYFVTEYEYYNEGWYDVPTKVSMVGYASLITIGPATV